MIWKSLKHCCSTLQIGLIPKKPIERTFHLYQRQLHSVAGAHALNVRCAWPLVVIQRKTVKCNGLLFSSTGRRSFLFPGFFNPPSKGVSLPGQGLKKLSKKEKEAEEENSLVLSFFNKRIEEQNEGRKKNPNFPDTKFFWNFSKKYIMLVLLLAVLYPEIKDILFAVEIEPTVEKAVISEAPQSALIAIYHALPLRFISRIAGRVAELELPNFSKKFILSSFCKIFGVNIDECLVKDFKVYSSIAQFFRRPLDPTCRPMDGNTDFVFPADGKILTMSKVNGGLVEQVKGLDYSIQKFLGPLVHEPIHENWDRKPGYKYIWSRVQPEMYQKALMTDPINNELFHCVIYLSPRDCHRFFSPVDWQMKHRRHFPAQLLSVNPKVAMSIKDLFVLNERVVLSGLWKHGYFSFTAVGATNVGSMKIYEDILLETNRPGRVKPGSYYDNFFGGDDGFEMKKGDDLGEFNFGSTVILIFEAPKDTVFNMKPGQTVTYNTDFYNDKPITIATTSEVEKEECNVTEES